MSKLKNAVFAFVALSVFMVIPALADSGCVNGKFIGSYTNTVSFPDFGATDQTAIQAAGGI